MNPFKLKPLLQTSFLLSVCVVTAASVNAQSAAVAKLENLGNEILVDPRPDDARMIDEYGQITSNNEKARLDNTLINLNNSPDAQLFVVVFGKTAAICQARSVRVLRYAVKQRGQDPSRLKVVVRPGKPDPKTQLWLVPPGAKPPG